MDVTKSPSKSGIVREYVVKFIFTIFFFCFSFFRKKAAKYRITFPFEVFQNNNLPTITGGSYYTNRLFRLRKPCIAR